MRPEKLYLLDIVSAAQAIQRFCEPIDEATFIQDELRQSAVLQKLIVIGEASAHLPVDFKFRYNEVEWEDIIGFRNIAVHEYFAVLWDIVWNTAIKDVPILHGYVTRILEIEFSSE
jgi:uncharacterized protein with HEPN domain